MKMKKLLLGLALAGGAVAAAAPHAKADAVSKFYKGKTIKAFVSSSPGGGYDTYTRVIARYMGAHIPGKPAIVVKNMPGARGVIMLNYMYNRAPKNGTVIGHVQRGAAFEPIIMKDKQARYDPLKFNWLASLNESISVLIVWHKTPFRTTDALFDPVHRIVVGSARGDAELFAVAMNNVLGTKVNIISSYPGNAESKLAMVRGEVDGMAAISVSSLNAQEPTWLKEKKVIPLVQYGMRKHPEIDPKVPLVLDMAKTEEQRQVLTAIFSRQIMGRPFLTTPGVPAARVAALKTALKATTVDPKFVKHAKKRKLEIHYIDGDAVKAMIEKIAGLPKPILEKARKALTERTFVKDIKLLSVKTSAWKLSKKGKRTYISFVDGSGKPVKLRIHKRRSKGKIKGAKLKGKALAAALKANGGMPCTIRYVGNGGNAVRVNCK